MRSSSVIGSLIVVVTALAQPAFAEDAPKPADTPKPADAAAKPADTSAPAATDAKPAADAGDKPKVEAGDKPKVDAPKATEAPKPDITLKANDKGSAKVQCPKGTLFCFNNDVFAVWPKIRVRPGFKYVDADPNILYIGHNDGFFLDEARFGAEGNVSDVVRFKLTIETASLLPGAQPNQTILPIGAAAADAWVAWTPSDYFIVKAGQQPMPSEYEGGDVEALIPFTHKSVMAGGVRNGEGEAVAGLSPLYQIGVVVGSADQLKLGDIPLEYRLGISNGNGMNLIGNDNKLPAGYVRIGSGFGDVFKIGVGGRFNPRSVGTLPNLYDETDAAAFVDAAVSIAGFNAVAEVEGRQTSFTTLVPDPTNPAGAEYADGAALWASYTIKLPQMAITPAYRISFYDPSSSFATDQLLENTIGARIDGDAATMPLSFIIDYTFLTEIGDLQHNVNVRDIADNRLTALFQIEL